MDLGLYRLLDRVFPQSYNLKLFFIAFVGIHVPLVVTMVWLLSSTLEASQALRGSVVLLIGTLVGTAFTLTGLHFALKPIEAATRALERYEASREIVQLPTGHADQAGQLLTSVSALVQTVDVLLNRQEQAAVIDPLTGVANRRGFREAVERVERNRQRDGTCALIALDVDNFKALNDTHGHVVGDLVLADLGRILSDHVRADQIVARYGGEEFLVFLPDATRENALAAAERIRQAIASHAFEACPQLRMTASAGVAVSPTSDCDIDDLYDLADQALYRAKRSGRNQVQIAGPSDLTNPDDGVTWA